MQNLRPFPVHTVNTISQERLETLRELQLKRAELLLLESRIAEQIMRDMQTGMQVEAGKWKVRLSTRQRGSKAEQRVVLY